MFGGNASGSMKLKPLLVYQVTQDLLIAMGSLSVMWKSNPKAWLTEAIFQDYFFHYFILEEEKYYLKKDI